MNRYTGDQQVDCFSGVVFVRCSLLPIRYVYVFVFWGGQAHEYRSWTIIKPMLEEFNSLPELLAAKPPDYSPPGFWDEFELETHATRRGSQGQVTEAVQASEFCWRRWCTLPNEFCLL